VSCFDRVCYSISSPLLPPRCRQYTSRPATVPHNLHISPQSASLAFRIPLIRVWTVEPVAEAHCSSIPSCWEIFRLGDVIPYAIDDQTVHRGRFLVSIKIYLPPQHYWTVEFLDNGATCNTSLVSRKTFPAVLKHIQHTTYTRRFESCWLRNVART